MWTVASAIPHQSSVVFISAVFMNEEHAMPVHKQQTLQALEHYTSSDALQTFSTAFTNIAISFNRLSFV